MSDTRHDTELLPTKKPWRIVIDTKHPGWVELTDGEYTATIGVQGSPVVAAHLNRQAYVNEQLVERAERAERALDDARAALRANADATLRVDSVWRRIHDGEISRSTGDACIVGDVIAAQTALRHNR